MPIYTFHCPNCDRQFESIQKMDTRAVPCPECGTTSERGIEVPGKFVWGRGGPFTG
jgi:putative FmdB family regulatory protein